GFTLPQKPWRLSYCKGALPVALSPELVDCVAAGADWSLGVELAGCWASAGRENKHATNNATTARFLIFNFLRFSTYSGGAAGLTEVAALSSTPRCTPFAGVIAILVRLKPVALELVRCRPALTPRWTEKHGVKS